MGPQNGPKLKKKSGRTLLLSGSPLHVVVVQASTLTLQHAFQLLQERLLEREQGRKEREWKERQQLLVEEQKVVTLQKTPARDCFLKKREIL